ncbi:MAG TPA: HNH endonuclease signature motif containing protein [Ktedonobacterales bacterium]
MSERVSPALRKQVVARARQCCEYCGLPDDVALVSHQPDHIIATKHGGQTQLDNLAYACYACNHSKGSDIASVDHISGAVTRLYHPRADRWQDHFRWDGARIDPLTPIGRATEILLRFNEPQRITIRANLLQQHRYPFAGWMTAP